MRQQRQAHYPQTTIQWPLRQLLARLKELLHRARLSEPTRRAAMLQQCPGPSRPQLPLPLRPHCFLGLHPSPGTLSHPQRLTTRTPQWELDLCPPLSRDPNQVFTRGLLWESLPLSLEARLSLMVLLLQLPLPYPGAIWLSLSQQARWHNKLIPGHQWGQVMRLSPELLLPLRLRLRRRLSRRCLPPFVQYPTCQPALRA